MKLKKGFITHETEGQQLLVPTGNSKFHGMVRSNRTAAFIVDQLKNDTTEDAIVAAMLEKYDAPEERIRSDVKRVIEQLRGIGAIED